MSRQNLAQHSEDGLMLSGYHKKLKTMKRKYFVLYKDTPNNVARMEYYDNERKFKSGLSPKRVIKLKHCFNINQRLDTKYNNVIALSTKDGSFGIVLETEEEMLRWLEVLISLQRSNANISDSFRPHYEHVWQVLVQKKGLAEEKGITGNYYVCLTPKSVTFIRIGPEKSTFGAERKSNVEVLLTTIRRCGDSHCVFYMEVGRQSIIGPGELWMETEDSLIAQNMHNLILSAMSAKVEANLEPMRKRSSSANEASKPINVLQRKQTQPDNKMNNSPLINISYGRERCDSLPSRNRTSSECSNQSLTSSSVNAIRNTTISGLRPHSYQRHSSSPPVSATTIGCSESEESSISIDEPDDNGCFLSYRYNSRSADGVIPEENTDELLNSDNKTNDDVKPSYQTKLPGNLDESYLSMAPVKNSKDLGDKFNSFKQLKSIGELKSLSSICSQNRNVTKTDIQFPEYTSDNVSKNLNDDIDSQTERPARAYSIGSKIEHNKMYKRLGNTNDTEQSTTRVRAFSVGSRAKIPRCDLQRGVLFPKYMMEQNSTSNNNISSAADATSYNHALNVNVCRDKKSTSAPLLIHKSQNSVDRMSDLMEIDFSKSSNHSNNRIPYSTKTLFSKSVPSTSRDQGRKFETAIPLSREEERLHNNSSLLSIKPYSKTDNGYLEMKPVGNLLSRSSPTSFSQKLLNCNTASNEYLTSIPKMSDSSNVPDNIKKEVLNMDSTVLMYKNDKTGNDNTGQRIVLSRDRITDPINIPLPKFEYDIKMPLGNPTIITQKQLSKPDICSVTPLDRMLRENKSNNDGLSFKYSQLTVSPKCEVITDDYINIEGKSPVTPIKPKTKHCKKICNNDIKLTHSASDEDYKYESHNVKNKFLPHESGYEILQIKSDSSLQSQKILNRPTLIRKDKQQCQVVPIRPKSTNSAPLISSSSSSSSTLCDCTFSSTSCLTNSPTAKVQPPKEPICPSRPSSVSSEHELHYAKLDLPQCSTDISAKVNKTDALVESFTHPVSNINNSYAKIDFDHSDSSSSSKNLNI